jgi:hypothetical protein
MYSIAVNKPRNITTANGRNKLAPSPNIVIENSNTAIGNEVAR